MNQPKLEVETPLRSIQARFSWYKRSGLKICKVGDVFLLRPAGAHRKAPTRLLFKQCPQTTIILL